jgi:hypothetical protein
MTKAEIIIREEIATKTYCILRSNMGNGSSRGGMVN